VTKVCTAAVTKLHFGWKVWHRNTVLSPIKLGYWMALLSL